MATDEKQLHMASSTPIFTTYSQGLSRRQAVALLVGANVGSGILSFPYAAAKSGFLPTSFWILVGALISGVSMLYLAEGALAGGYSAQFVGLANRWLGPWAERVLWVVSSLGCIGILTAYAIGGGQVVTAMLPVPHILGVLLFYLSGALSLWFSMKRDWGGQNIATWAMVLMVGFMVTLTAVRGFIVPQRLASGDFRYSFPLFGLAIFSFLAQYQVPEIVQGLTFRRKEVYRSIFAGNLTTALAFIVVTGAVLGALGPAQITEVSTLGWGKLLGPGVFVLAGGVTLLAMYASMLAIGQVQILNNVEFIKARYKGSISPELLAFLLVVLPPLLIVLLNLTTFVDALYFVGVIDGAVATVFPVLIWRAVRKAVPWFCNSRIKWLENRVLQALVVILGLVLPAYLILQHFGVFPSAW